MNYRIDYIPAKFAADKQTKLKGLHDYVVPCGMSSIQSMSDHPVHFHPRTIPADQVAIFSRWNADEQDYIIWQIK